MSTSPIDSAGHGWASAAVTMTKRTVRVVVRPEFTRFRFGTTAGPDGRVPHVGVTEVPDVPGPGELVAGRHPDRHAADHHRRGVVISRGVHLDDLPPCLFDG